MTDKLTLQTFAGNLRYAIRNRQSAIVGGGEFSPDELKTILAAIEDTVMRERLAAIREKIYDEHATGLDS